MLKFSKYYALLTCCSTRTLKSQLFIHKGTGIICVSGSGSHRWVWGSYMLLCEYQDLNRSLFLDCSTRSEAGGRVCKVYDQVFCRIYGHDLKLEEYKRKTVFPCRDLVDSIHFLPCDVHLQVRSIRENVRVRALKDR